MDGGGVEGVLTKVIPTSSANRFAREACELICISSERECKGEPENDVATVLSVHSHRGGPGFSPAVYP